MNKKKLLSNILFGFCLLLFSPKIQSQSLDDLANQADQLVMTNLDSSLILYQQLEQLALEKNDKKAYAYAIINSAGVCNHKHRYEEAREICLRGLTKQPFPIDSFEIIMTLGQSYDQDDIQMADSLFKEAEKIVSTLNDSTLFTSVYLGLGNTSFSKGSFYESLDYYFKCLEFSKSPKDSYRRSGLLVSLSRIFLELDNLKLAEKYLNEGLQIQEKNKYKKRYDRTSVIFANLLLKKGNIDAAQNEITSTRNWLMENNRYGYRSSNANTQASIFIIQKKWDEAEASLIQAFEEWKNMKSTDNISYIPLLINRCSILFHQKKYDQVLATITEVKQLTQIFQSPILKKQVLEFERKIFEKKNQPAKAYAALSQIRKIEEDLFQKDKVFSTNYLESEFNRKEQESAIALLDVQNEIQANQLSQQRNLLIIGGLALGLISLLSFFLYRLYKRVDHQKILLSKALGEKDTLLREIHHRVKNNLQLVSSLLGLQSDHIEDPQALEALNSGKSRVKSMALIHQDLYKKENLTGLSVTDYLQKLGNELINSYEINPERIELKLEAEDLNLDVDTLVPLGLIINELLTNSLKYAFPNKRKGFIHVQLFEKNNQLNLSVADNGVGIDKEAKSESGFGFQLIETLLEQLEGEMIQEEKDGTHFSFKMNYYKKAA